MYRDHFQVVCQSSGHKGFLTFAKVRTFSRVFNLNFKYASILVFVSRIPYRLLLFELHVDFSVFSFLMITSMNFVN